MAKLVSKKIDTTVTSKEKRIKKKPLSEAKIKAIAALTEQIEATTKCAEIASQQKANFEQRYNSVPGCETETSIGSTVTSFLLSRSQSKYYLTRWEFASKAIDRRFRRLEKILSRKLKETKSKGYR